MRSKKILLAVMAIWVITLNPVSLFAQESNDCREKIPNPERYLNLTGEWMDNSVNRKVTITQDGTTIDHIIKVTASYLVPYKCAQRSQGGNVLLLDRDFEGQLSQANLGAHPEITGSVFICQDVRGPNNIIHSERVEGKLTSLTVDDSRDSMTGGFIDPVKGIQDITLTRLSKIIPPPAYKDQTAIKTLPGAKIYQEPLRSSRVRYTPPAGIHLIFENDHTVLDADGTPLWYFVTNAGGGSIGTTNTGWIRASQIACIAPHTNAPK